MGIAKRLASLCAIAMLTACASVDDKATQNHVPTLFDDVEVKFTELGAGYVRQGVAIAPQVISQVVPGIDKSSVRQLLGHPVHESDPRWWEYHIRLPLGAGNSELVCQYGITFDAAGQVTRTEWRRPQCSSLYAELNKPAPQEVEEITLFSDVLFGFDSATLTAEGRRELDLAAGVVSGKAMQLDRILVIGHTDRIGAVSYNDKLSLRRAEAVRSYLISRGIDSRHIFAEGRGSREPVTYCEGAVNAALKQCLQPNRRVQIMIYGQR